MKTLLFVSIILVGNFISSHAQSNALNFSYDQNGRIIERKLVVSLGGSRLANFSTKEDSLIERSFSEFNVYPNPASTEITIEGEMPGQENPGVIKIFNSAGQEIQRNQYNNKQQSIYVGGLAPGAYILDIKYSDKARKSYKILITN